MRVKKFQEADTQYDWNHDAPCNGVIHVNRDVMPAQVFCEVCGPLSGEEKIYVSLDRGDEYPLPEGDIFDPAAKRFQK